MPAFLPIPRTLASCASVKINIPVLEPTKQYKFEFSDYPQAGNELGVSINKEKSILNKNEGYNKGTAR